MEINVGNQLEIKKAPLRQNRFEMLQIGTDFSLKCMGCGHKIITPRSKAEGS